MTEARTLRRDRKIRTLTNLFRNNRYPKTLRTDNRLLCRSEINGDEPAAKTAANSYEQDATGNFFLEQSSNIQRVIECAGF